MLREDLLSLLVLLSLGIDGPRSGDVDHIAQTAQQVFADLLLGSIQYFQTVRGEVIHKVALDELHNVGYFGLDDGAGYHVFDEIKNNIREIQHRSRECEVGITKRHTNNISQLKQQANSTSPRF